MSCIKQQNQQQQQQQMQMQSEQRREEWGGARNCKALHGMKRLRERKGTSNRILDLPEKKGRKKRDEKTPAQICNWGKKYTLWFADIPGNSLEKFCKLATGKSISKLR